MTDNVVIVGAGHAAGQAVASLRQGGWDEDIILIGEEDHLPYQRPPLSKKFLSGELPQERLLLRPADFYDAQTVERRLGVRAARIDRARKTIALSDGGEVGYGKVILATGARVRRLPCPGGDLDGVFYLRSIADVDAIRPRFTAGARIAIVGAGYIGLEVAAVAASRGLAVTVLEAAPRVMARVTSPTISAFFQDVHRAAGVDIRLGAGLERFAGDGRLERLHLADGTAVEADFAVVGVGVAPNQEIAAEAGLKADNGVWVDEFACTEDPDIYAVGDCTNHPNALLGRRLRLESVHNALEQAKTAAAAICGKPAAYAQIPWFWSDQYDLKLQTVGLCAGADREIVRGDPAARKFSVCYLKDGVVIAVDAVNLPADFMAAKLLVAKGGAVDVDRLADSAVALKALL
ncbi:MAG: FAD-dependent oxidoreductase [Caulobacterales bacterium]|nr:FAD-dependent oxidoreductase [Caulobacterales bacterium]